MMAQKCIYCPNLVRGRGEGDHIIPAALGEFVGDTHFHRICASCNNRIGQAEQQILQCGPEALERLARTGRRGRQRQRPHLVGARGMPPPETIQLASEGNRSVDLIDHQNCTPVDEVTILDEKNQWRRLRLHPEMTADSLKKMVRRLGVKEIRRCNLFASSDHYDRYVALFKEAWPESGHVPVAQEPAGVRQVQAMTTFKVTDDYFRAIAKIAFHHYLVFSLCANGDEPEFQGIRRFITQGGDPDEFFLKKVSHFAIAMSRRYRHPHRSHYVAFDESGEKVKAYVWLFVKDDPATVPYQIEWPCRRTVLVLPRPCQAHEYRYEDVIDHKQADGRVYEKAIFKSPGQQFLTIL